MSVNYGHTAPEQFDTGFFYAPYVPIEHINLTFSMGGNPCSEIKLDAPMTCALRMDEDHFEECEELFEI